MHSLRVAYVAVFGLAAAVCFASVWRAASITDRDTKRGLVGLLVLSGAWAAASVGRIAAPSTVLQRVFHTAGLVAGLASVGAWLYFCSAYAGYDYHYRSRIRRVAATVFLLIVGVKLTNPIHSLYFRSYTTQTPFPHLAVELTAVHWTVTGLAYSLSAVGFYLLYELFRETQFETTSLGVLVSLTALPAVANIVAIADVEPNLLLPFNYEPIGVALFAVGVLYVVDETFVAVPRRWRTALVNSFDSPIILLTHDGSVRDFNQRAAALLPPAESTLGEPLEAVAPELHTAVERPGDVVEVQHDDETKFYTGRPAPLMQGDETVGTVLVYDDVTDIERQRRELKRQNGQLNDFSVALNHELRNAITVLQGFLDQAGQSVTHGTVDFDSSDVRRANNAVGRMQRVIGDLSTMARYGQTPETTSECEIRPTVAAAFATEAFEELAYTVECDATILANHPRLEELFVEAFQFAHANGASTVTVAVSDDVLSITGDGDSLAPDVVDDALDFGPPEPRGMAEMSLPNIRLLARTQGWTARVDESYEDGVRIRISGITVVGSGESSAVDDPVSD